MPTSSRTDLTYTDNGSESDNRKESLARRIRSKLDGSAYGPVRQLSCERRNGSVVVSGQLPSYFLKQVAISLALHCTSDGECVDHEIDVR